MMQSGERGSTLLLVTWLLAIMGIIATFLIYRAEAEWAVVLKTEETVKLRERAEQALYEKLALLLDDETEHDTPDEPWFNKTGRFTWEDEAGYTITVLVEDEGSKPNLNLMDGEALTGLLPMPDSGPEATTTPEARKFPEATSAAKEQKFSFDPLFDWRDVNQDKREDGAELEYYQSLKPPYKPRDGFFSSLDELLAVKGGKELYPHFLSELTVYGKLNLNVLQRDQLDFIFSQVGFRDDDCRRLWEAFDEYKNNRRRRFETLKALDTSEFSSLAAQKGVSINRGLIDKLVPLFNLSSSEEQFTGSCNLYLASGLGLKTILKTSGFLSTSVGNQKDIPSEVIQIVNRRKTELPDSTNFLEALSGILRIQEDDKKQRLNDYFTTKSSIFRYRVWVTKGKGNQQYFINTVQERLAGDLRTRWKLRTLYWQALSNRKVPEIPKMTPFEATLVEPYPNGPEGEGTQTPHPDVSPAHGDAKNNQQNIE